MIAISVDDLRSWGACEDQVLIFQRIFGDSAEVSEENLSRAREGGLNLRWLAGNPSTPTEALRVLASDPAEGVRACVAGNPSTPTE